MFPWAHFTNNFPSLFKFAWENWFWCNCIVGYHVSIKFLSEYLILTWMRAVWNFHRIWITMPYFSLNGFQVMASLWCITLVTSRVTPGNIGFPYKRWIRVIVNWTRNSPKSDDAYIYKWTWPSLIGSGNGFMMTSSNRNIFRVAGRLCGGFTGHWWIPLTKASDAELSCFVWSALEQTIE